VTTPGRIKNFESQLVRAVKAAQTPDAELKNGDYCRWCAAKPICPVMTGAVDRAYVSQIEGLDAAQIGAYLEKADLVESWVKDLRALATQILETGRPVPGYKLVAKRGTRKWIDEDKAKETLLANLTKSDVVEESLISPAQAEKLLKKQKLPLPEGLVVSVSSGSTLAQEEDPRPSVLLIGQQLSAALSKLG
jgi:hypothetical protein